MECSEWLERFENNANQPPQILVFVFFGIFVILADIRGQFGTPSGPLNFYRHFFQNFSIPNFGPKSGRPDSRKLQKHTNRSKKLAKDIQFIIQNIYTMQKTQKQSINDLRSTVYSDFP